MNTPRLLIALIFLALTSTIYLLYTPNSPTVQAATSQLPPFVVNSLDDTDDGSCDEVHCSLREAINLSNQTTGANIIDFSLPAPYQIDLLSPLPTIFDPVIIDAGSQPGTICPFPTVRLDGSALGEGVNGLTITAGLTIVRGLIIQNFSGHGVALFDSGYNKIYCSLIGSDYTGADYGNGGAGIYIENSAHNFIGGYPNGADLGPDGNLIVFNGTHGIQLVGSSSFYNTIIGNLIGSSNNCICSNGHGVFLEDAPFNSINYNVIAGHIEDGIHIAGENAYYNSILGNQIGTTELTPFFAGNLGDGIEISSYGNTVGGVGYGNIINANAGNGIFIHGSLGFGNVVQANLIGTLDANNNNNLGNFGHGILIADGATYNWIGSYLDGSDDEAEGNTISFNAGSGIVVQDDTSLYNSFHNNSIFQNGGLGIDLGGDNQPNPGTGAPGPNNFQPFPELLEIRRITDTLVISGTLTTNYPENSYHLEFYGQLDCDPSGYGEGEQLLGSMTVTTDENGFVPFTFFTESPNFGDGFVTATATSLTDPKSGNTSEFSACQWPSISEYVEPGEDWNFIPPEDWNNPISFFIPGEVFTETTEMVFTRIPTPTQESLPQDVTFYSHSFDLTAYRQGLPIENLQFSQPMQVIVTYDDSGLTEEEELLLRMYYYDEGLGSWFDVATSCHPFSEYIHDTEANQFEVEVCHLTGFGVFNTPLAPPIPQLFLPILFR